MNNSTISKELFIGIIVTLIAVAIGLSLALIATLIIAYRLHRKISYLTVRSKFNHETEQASVKKTEENTLSDVFIENISTRQIMIK